MQASILDVLDDRFANFNLCGYISNSLPPISPVIRFDEATSD